MSESTLNQVENTLNEETKYNKIQTENQNIDSQQTQKQSVQTKTIEYKEEEKTCADWQVKKNKKKKKNALVQDKLSIFQRELEDKWKMIFVFDPRQMLKLRGKKNKVTDDDLDEFLRDLQQKMEKHQIQNLNHFSLDLSKCSQFTDDGLQHLASHVSTTLKDTTFLDLNFISCKISDHGVKALSTSIGTNLKDLEHLSIKFKYCYQVGKEGFQSINTQIISKCPNIKSLSLEFSSSCGVNDRDAAELINSITNLGSLEHLELNLQGIPIKDETFGYIGQQIGTKLPTLKTLKLDFHPYQKVTEQGVQDFSIGLGQNLPQLQILELNFSRSKFTDVALESLANHLIPQLKNLQHLMLNFDGCPKLTNIGSSKLIKSITTNLLRLTYLDINSNGFFTITDQDLKELSIYIGENLKNLQALKLGLAGVKVTDQGLQNLLDNLGSNLKSVQGLSLDLSGCKQLTDKQIRQVGMYITSQFNNLKQLDLTLKNCKQITDPTKKFLETSLKSVPRVDLRIS